MTADIYSDKDYKDWLAGLKEKIRQSQLKAALKINAEMLALYWELGKAIIEKQKQSDWGDKIIKQLATDLSTEFREIKGFSRSNLFNIRKWYLFYSNDLAIVQQVVGLLPDDSHPPDDGTVQQPVGQLPILLSLVPWGHHIQIVTKCSTIEEARYYLLETARNNWQRTVLIYNLETNHFYRKGRSHNNFDMVLPKAQSELAKELIKSPYYLDFLNLSDEATERDLENAMTANFKKLFMEMGFGFSFIGQQVPLHVGDKDYRLDLFFYHTRLHCYFVVELKVIEFEPEHAGKLEFYLEAVDRQFRKEGDNPSMGLLLCKSADKVIVAYSLVNKTKPISIAEFSYTATIPQEWANELPAVEILKEELAKEIKIPKKPVDEKIEKLKELIQGIKGEAAVSELSKDIIDKILTTIIKPLQSIVEKKMEEIAGMFITSRIRIMCNGQVLDSPDAPLPVEIPYMLGFSYDLEGFKKAGTKAFNVYNMKLEFFMQKLKYTVGPEQNRIWEERLYHQLHTGEELEMLADRFVEMVVDDMERQILQTGRLEL